MTMTDDRLEEMPAAPRRRPRWLVLLLAVFVLAGLTLYGGYRYVAGAIEGGTPGEQVVVTIPKGGGTEGVAKALSAAGVISRPKVFTYWTKLEGKGPYLAGTYTLAKHSGYEAVADVLAKGPEVSSDRLVVPEGFTVDQIAERVGKLPGRSADTFKALAHGTAPNPVVSPLAPDKKDLEGLLFPSTYFIGQGEDERKILQKMVDAMVQVGRDVDVTGGAGERKLTPYQVLIVASLIEREAKVDEDRPLVGEVIYNRLAKGQRLEIDASVIYGLGGGKTRVLADDLKRPTPYNTYLNAGLPPTPIASPGKASIEAAIDPAEGPFLFYVVVDKDGRHAFATTLAEHQANIAKAKANGVR